jgi:type III pantothenate kinase
LVILLIDAGNTSTVLGLAHEGGIQRRWRISTVGERTADEYRLMLGAILEEAGVRPSGAALSSVVPVATAAMRAAIPSLIDGPLVVVGPGVKTGMALQVDNPKEVGADRVVNAIGAVERLGAPVIVVDFGTATTVDLISAEAEYCGGAIAPGLEISAAALVSATAALRRVELVPPRAAVGRSTVDAIQSGLIFGYAGLVDGLIDRIASELGTPAPVIATGGLAELVVPHCRLVSNIDPDLTLIGLEIVYRRNTS